MVHGDDTCNNRQHSRKEPNQCEKNIGDQHHPGFCLSAELFVAAGLLRCHGIESALIKPVQAIVHHRQRISSASPSARWNSPIMLSGFAVVPNIGTGFVAPGANQITTCELHTVTQLARSLRYAAAFFVLVASKKASTQRTRQPKIPQGFCDRFVNYCSHISSSRSVAPNFSIRPVCRYPACALSRSNAHPNKQSSACHTRP